jgi:hypothetical protein
MFSIDSNRTVALNGPFFYTVKKRLREMVPQLLLRVNRQNISSHLSVNLTVFFFLYLFRCLRQKHMTELTVDMAFRFSGQERKLTEIWFTCGI